MSTRNNFKVRIDTGSTRGRLQLASFISGSLWNITFRVLLTDGVVVSMVGSRLRGLGFECLVRQTIWVCLLSNWCRCLTSREWVCRYIEKLWPHWVARVEGNKHALLYVILGRTTIFGVCLCGHCCKGPDHTMKDLSIYFIYQTDIPLRRDSRGKACTLTSLRPWTLRAEKGTTPNTAHQISCANVANGKQTSMCRVDVLSVTGGICYFLLLSLPHSVAGWGSIPCP